ncbi:hypothetical protein [Salinibaculum rarum]|uniref:hypothetical protein n=1 Tax=Salinibaculum rarum TaxID=3058903 RepID=UPI00265E59F4|nr:hypothetical protein [Salinibaculum sp. KK48]
MSGERLLLVDASVAITLARVDSFGLLAELDGQVTVPEIVLDEVDSEPAKSTLEAALDDWLTCASVLGDPSERGETAETARTQLGIVDDGAPTGDLALLTQALRTRENTAQTAVVVSDDKPLRQTCKALSIPVSGSIGVLIRAVERDALAPADAKDSLLAMDEVGARLSASLLRRAERLIDEAVDD